MGRPSKISEDKINIAIKLAQENKTIVYICNFLGINRQTLYNWSATFPELKQRIDEEKRLAELKEIASVRKSLIKRAKGYKTREVKEHFDDKGKLISYDITTKEVPANVKAQQFYLTNKAPNEWKISPDGLNQDGENDNEITIKVE